MNNLKITNFDDMVIRDFKNNTKLIKDFKKYIVKQYKKDRDIKIFKENLKLIIKAERGLATKIVKTAKIDRAGIYRILSSKVMPRYDTFEKLLMAMGYNIDRQLT